jgi:tripartite-type tricarboxylate transporter receptor subunit TctC
MRQQLLSKLEASGTLLLGSALLAHPALAQEFPKKQPIKIIVPYNPGGGTDALARVTAEFLQHRLGQAVIVENKAGASSTIGADYVAKSQPDGHTLLFVAGGDLTAVPAVRTNLPFKFDQFTFLVRGFTAEPMLLASPKLPVSTVPELVSYMKANPGKVTLGTPGLGHIVHLGMAMLESAAGVKSLVVPYNGSGPVYTEMLAGNIDVTLATPPFPDGLKILGSVGTRRNPMYANAATIEEVGIKNASWDNWFGIVGPPHLPKPIADRLIDEVGAVLKTPEAIAKFRAVAKTPPDSDPLTGEAFKNRVIEENNRWKSVVARENITIQ